MGREATNSNLVGLCRLTTKSTFELVTGDIEKLAALDTYWYIQMYRLIEHKKIQNAENMGSETDLVNVVNRRKLQHFSHVVRDQNVCCVTCHVFEGRSTDKETIVKPTTSITNNVYTTNICTAMSE